jgi:hypothetical protein
VSDDRTLMPARVLTSHNRLIDLVAEDNALEDTMYHLHRALSAGRLDLDRFLRVRASPDSRWGPG